MYLSQLLPRKQCSILSVVFLLYNVKTMGKKKNTEATESLVIALHIVSKNVMYSQYYFFDDL